jgi:hypothetical protein
VDCVIFLSMVELLKFRLFWTRTTKSKLKGIFILCKYFPVNIYQIFTCNSLTSLKIVYAMPVIRNGSCSIFIFTEPLSGCRHVTACERRTRIDWANQIRELLEIYYLNTPKIRLVMDNLNTHSIASLYEAFPPEIALKLAKRLEIHYTPKHGSWLNIAEIELSVLLDNV